MNPPCTAPPVRRSAVSPLLRRLRRRVSALPRTLLPLCTLLLVLLAAPAPAAVASVSGGVPPSAPPAAAGPEGAPGLAVEGSDFAWLRVDRAVEVVESYANAGYDLEVRRAEDGGMEAVVRVDLAPLGDGGDFSPPPEPEPTGEAAVGPVVALARRLTARAGTRYEAASAILGWMVHNVVSEETAALAQEIGADGGAPPEHGEADEPEAAGTGGEPGPAGSAARPAAGSSPTGSAQRGAGTGSPRGEEGDGVDGVSAAAVLERGSGNPQEVARLAVVLLEAAGLEARVVRGRVVGPPEIGSPHGPHSWIEVHYPPRGWAFSDPLHHHHYVPATYLRFKPAAAAAGQGEPAAVPPVTLVERRDRRETVDLYPPGAPGVTARKGAPGQRAGALRVVVAGGARGSAVLEGEKGRTSKMLVAGESVFVGLEGGAYRLEVYLEGRPPIVRELRVGERERRAVYLRKPADDGSPGEAPAAARGGSASSSDGLRRSRPRP